MHPACRWKELQKCLAQHTARYPGIRRNILRRALISCCRRAGDMKLHPAYRRKGLQKCLAQHPERYPGIRLNILRRALISCCLGACDMKMHPPRDRDFTRLGVMKLHPACRRKGLQKCLAQHPERYPRIRLNILRRACLSGCRSKEMIACRRRNGAPARRQCLRHAARPEDV